MASTQHSRYCEKGCGRPAFGKFRTCCTHCRGPTGPHAHDCESKAKAASKTPSTAASRASPTPAMPRAQGAYAQPAVQPQYAQPGVQPVYSQPGYAPASVPPVYDAPQRMRGRGMGMAAGAGAVGLGAGLVGGMMLESALERERYGYGGMGFGSTEFVDVRRGPFETDIVDVRRDMFGGTDIIEERRGLFGTDITEVRTDMFGDREVIHEHVGMFGDVTYTDEFSGPGFFF